MQFHGIGREEHSAQSHHVTNCLHDHSHYKLEADTARAASSIAKAQEQQAESTMSESGLSLAAWLERTLSRGKGLLRNFWGDSQGEAGDKASQAQTGHIGEAADRGAGITGTDTPGALHSPQMIAQAAAAVPHPRAQEAISPADQAGGAKEDGPWQRMRVRFQEMAGRLKGQLQKNAFSFHTKSSLNTRQERPRQEARKGGRARRDAVEIDSYRVEESYLLDSYDRKGGYSKISTKK